MDEAVAIGPLGVTQSLIVGAWGPRRGYDLYLTALSWESRCTYIASRYGTQLPSATVLRFDSSDPAVDKAKDVRLCELGILAPVCQVLRLSKSTDLQPNYKAIESLLRDRSTRAKRPLRVLVDITCLPKAYVMFLVGAGFLRDYLAVLDCLYAAGTYDHAGLDNAKTTAAVTNRSLVSLGDWRPELIPYLRSTEMIPTSRDLLVTLGGELGMARTFMDRVEPDRTMLVFIAEDAPGPDRSMAQSERIALKHLLEDSHTTRQNLSLGDVISVAEQAIGFVRESNCSGVTGMALGAKSHALGLAIAALSESRLEIISRVPAGYKGIDVLPSGQIYLFELSDRFEPCSYIDT